MLIKDLRKLIKSEYPCEEGLKWFNKASKNHINTTTFFKSLEKTEFDKWAWSPHGYIRWIFYNCLDWDDVVGFRLSGGSHLTAYIQYQQFIKKHFNVDMITFLPIQELCKALSRAFEDDE